MKKIITLLLFLSIFASCKQKIDGYVISGDVKGLPDSTIMVLSRRDGDIGIGIAFDTVIGGKFMFRDTLQKEKERLSIMWHYGGKYSSMSLDVYVDNNTKVKITGDNELIRTWKVVSDIEEQKEYNSYIELNIDNLNKLQLINIEQSALRQKVRETDDPNERQRLRDEAGILEAKSDSINKLIRTENYKILEKSPVTDIWMDELHILAWCVKDGTVDKISLEQVEKLYERMTPQQKESATGQKITLKLYPPKVVGAGDPMIDADSGIWREIPTGLPTSGVNIFCSISGVALAALA